MTEIPIPLSLLYELADDSPLKGAWNLKGVHEKLEDLFGPGGHLEGLGDTLCLPIDTTDIEEKDTDASTEA